MPPDDKQKVEIEVAIRDGFSTVLKELGKQLGAVNKQAQDIGMGPSAAYNKFKRENDQLAEAAKRSNTQFSAMGTLFTTIGRSLIGPAGVVGGFYEAARALDSFASGRIQLRNLSADVGFSTSQISIMQRTMANMGMSSQESLQIITGVGSKLKEMFTLGLGSQLMQDLNEMGEAKWAGQLKKVIDTGDYDQAWKMILEKGNSGSQKFQEWFESRMGIPKSVMQSYKAASEGVVAMTEADLATLEKYHKSMNLITTKIEDAWHRVAISAIEAIKLMNNSKVADFLRDTKVELPDTDPAKAREALAGAFDKFRGSKSDAYPQAEDPMGSDYTRRQFHSKEYWRGGSGSDYLKGNAGSDTLIQVETDSNKMLRDIRDMMQRSEIGVGGSGGGGGTAGSTGYSSGQARRGILEGIKSSEGYRSGGGGSRGDRNNNPGNLKFGPHAKAFGATHADSGGFAVFPNMESGNAAQDTLLKSDRYKGLTLDQFGDKYAEGSASWKKTVGGALGIGGNDIVDNQDPRLQGAIKRAEGTGGGGGGGGNGIPSSILQEAKAAALKGGPGEVQRYIQSKGYNVNSAWCGDFAAAVVTGAGGKPPKNYSIASSWRNWGSPVEGDPQPGDIAIRKQSRFGGGYVPTGATGSHVNVVERFDPETGQFRGIGGNQSSRTASFSRGAYEFRRGANAEAREQIDKAQSASGGGNNDLGTASVDVDFKNMPSWVKTNVDANGAFKKLSVTRSAPQGAKAGDGIADETTRAYE